MSGKTLPQILCPHEFVQITKVTFPVRNQPQVTTELECRLCDVVINTVTRTGFARRG